MTNILAAVLASPPLEAGAVTSIRAIALYGGVVLGALGTLLWRQEIGIYLLTLLLPLQTTRYHLHAFPLGANIVDILLFCTIAGALLRPTPTLRHKSVIGGFLLFLAFFYYISLWRGAFFLDGSMPLWFDNVRLVDYKNFMVMPLLAMAAALTLRTRRQLVIVLALCAATALAVDFSYLKSSVGRDFSHYSEQTRDAGPLGYAGENGLAAYAVEIVAFLLPFLALKRHALAKVVLIVTLAATITCVLFSYSREAYLALAACLCFLAVVRLRWLVVPLLLLSMAWQTVLPTAVQERVAMTYRQPDEGQAAKLDASAQERVRLWTDAMALFHEYPVFGTGFLTYAHMDRVGPYRDTHNFYLKMLVETGIIGLLLFICQLFLFFREGFGLFRRASDSFLSLFGLGFASLVLAATIVNLFGDRWMFIQVDSNLWILLGAVLSASSLAEAPSPELAPADAFPARIDGDGFRFAPGMSIR